MAALLGSDTWYSSWIYSCGMGLKALILFGLVFAGIVVYLLVNMMLGWRWQELR